jgi:hypothetical protein
LRGNLSLLKSVSIPPRQLYVCCAFAGHDVDDERQSWMQRIICQVDRSKSLADIIFIDLSGLTKVECEEEICRCCDHNGGLFFVVMEGQETYHNNNNNNNNNKSTPQFSQFIDQNELQSTLKMMTDRRHREDCQAFIDDWYRLDSNQCPPRYVLRNNMCDPVLCTSRYFHDFMLSLTSPENSMFSSALQQAEFAFSLGPRRVFRIHTEDTLVNDENDNTHSCISRKAYSNRLSNDTHGNYQYKLWKGTVSRLILIEIERINSSRKQWKENLCLSLISDEIEEQLHHLSLCRYYDSVFVDNVQSPSIGELEEFFIFNNDQRPVISPLKPQRVVLFGGKGVGKATLLSVLVNRLSAQNREPSPQKHRQLFIEDTNTLNRLPIICRFCGTSEDSLSFFRLLRGLCIQILWTYDDPQLSSFLSNCLTWSTEQLMCNFTSLLMVYPVYLFLGNIDEVFSGEELLKLANCALHSSSRMLLTCSSIQFPVVLSESRCDWIGFRCSSLTTGVDLSFIKVLLFRKHRVLTSAQYAILSATFRDHFVDDQKSIQAPMLFHTIFAQQLSLVESSENDLTLPFSVNELVHSILGHCRCVFGDEFLCQVLFLLTKNIAGGIDSIPVLLLVSLSCKVLL